MTTVYKLLSAGTILLVIAILWNDEPVANQVSTQQLIPSIELSELITGEAIQLDMIEGNFVLNIWGSWCVACAREHDFLLKLQQSGVRLVGVAYMDSSESALQWLHSKGNPYSLSLLDSDGVLGEALNIKGAPETYVVNNSGYILYKHSGMLTEENWPKLAIHLKQQTGES